MRFRLLLLALMMPCHAADPGPSPENQVFQWSVSGESAPWPDGSKARGTLYLWIPEQCTKVRGVLILATNVPEHRLVGHPAIRRACSENDLALAWSVPTFWRFGKTAPQPGAEPVDVKALPGSDERQAAFLESLLEQLARRSGYDEIATAPWLPIGESGHLLMVCGLTDSHPARTIAGICVKNPHPPRNRSVPMLWTLGTAQEWGQKDHDPREHWKPATFNYQKWVKDRAAADWPLSILVEPGSGHFYCTDAMTEYFARYITAACRARLSDDGSPTLKPVSLDHGVLADLPLPGYENAPVTSYSAVAPTDRNRPWFFDETTARGAQAFAAVDWNAATALPSITAVENCVVNPFTFNSVTTLEVTTDAEFTIKPVLLEKIPTAFRGAGSPLAMPTVEPVAEWLCGPFAPLGGGRFRIALDRTWKTGAAAYMAVRHDSAPGVRFGVQPVSVRLVENSEGASQMITFAPIMDVKADAAPIALTATSDAGLPVGFFVVSGPATINDGRLVFTKIPPRARFPVEVAVAAWQWGRCSAPKVKTAPVVRQTFLIQVN
jgi:hypothetical protein